MSKIPFGWHERKLREVIREAGKRNKNLEVSKVLSVSNKHGLTDPENLFGRRIASEVISNYKIISKGQFAYNPSRLLVGSLAIKKDDGEAALSPLYVIFDTNDEIDKTYLFNWLFSESTKQKFVGAVQGGVRDSVSYDALSDLDIELPPLDEQKKIAEILTSVDRVIELTSMEIDKLKDLKKGMMQELLTKGIGHTKFKDSPVGKIPESWDCAEFENVCREICVGIVVKPSQYYRENGVAAFRSANVRENRINDKDFVYISSADNEVLKKSKVYEGDLLTVRTGYPGTTCIIDSRFNGSNCVDVIISRPRHEIVLSQFLCNWINSDYGKGQVLKFQGGLAQQHFNVGELKVLQIPIPKLDEQKKIVEKLQSVEKMIEKKELYLTNIEDLKKGLMNDLLTGKVRVKVL